MFTQEQLQDLLAFDGGDAPVISVYLNADTGQENRETIKLQTRALLKDLQADAADARAIEHYLDHEFDWSHDGLVLFSCHAADFFRAYPVAVSFRNRARSGRRPYVKPLMHLLDHYAHYGVILVDRVGARFFEFHLGELAASSETSGEEVRKLKTGGGSSTTGMRGGNHGDRQEDSVAQRNFRAAATAAERFFQRKKIRRLFLGGTPENVAHLRDQLSKRLQSCLAGTFAIEIDAGESDIRRQSLALLAAANADRESRLVESLVTTAAKEGNAVTGVEKTLQAVNEGRVATLVIADGLQVPGYAHPESGFVTNSLVYSPYNVEELEPLSDVIETAVARTMDQGGHVEVISGNVDLEANGRIGALLRY